jgi:predicted DNA-binding protein (MmcQ/YjbR family)
MNDEEARAFLLSLPEAWEDYPFGPDVAVMKVADRMFATLAPARGVWRANLKCDPDEALILRDIFPAVLPGYHMNKRHWNTVLLDGTIPRGELERMMENSYDLVIAKLPTRVRRPLERMRREPQS